MKKEYKELDGYIKKAKSILILSHSGADPDAVTSVLLMKEMINRFYSGSHDKKDVDIRLQGPLPKINYNLEIPGVDKINLFETSDDLDIDKYDLAIITDMGALGKCIKDVGEDFFDNLPHIYIDHHDHIPTSNPLLVINEKRGAIGEQIFVIFNELFPDHEITESESKYIQIGIITDTNNMLYEKVSSETYEIMAKVSKVFKPNVFHIMKEGNYGTVRSIEVFGAIVKSTIIDGNMAYAFIPKSISDDEYFLNEDLQRAKRNFIENYIRNIKDVDWSFIFSESRTTPGNWNISFRGVQDVHTVSQYAEALGGGGHLYAGGARVQGETEEEALSQILEAIKSTDA